MPDKAVPEIIEPETVEKIDMSLEEDAVQSDGIPAPQYPGLPMNPAIFELPVQSVRLTAEIRGQSAKCLSGKITGAPIKPEVTIDLTGEVPQDEITGFETTERSEEPQLSQRNEAENK